MKSGVSNNILEESNTIFLQIVLIEDCLFTDMKYRGRYEIYNAILESIMTGASRTKIMFDVSMSSDQADEYLKFLQACKLAAEQKRHFYKITEKGIEFLSRFHDMNKFVAIKSRPEITAIS